MTVSEHTTTLPVSRRRLLAGAGAAVAATAVSVPTLSVAATQLDAELLSAFTAWVAIQREMECSGEMDDDDFGVLCAKADAAAYHALTFAPETAIGVAAQFHLAAHLAFCSKVGDLTAVDYRDRGGEELRIMRPMFDRAAEMTASLRAGVAA